MTSISKIPPSELRQLAASYNIQTSYEDVFGKRQTASSESLLLTLQALDAPIHRARDIPKALREQEARAWEDGLEPVAVAWDGRLPTISLRLEAAKATGKVHCRIVLESGEVKEWSANIEDLKTAKTAEIDGRRFFEKKLPQRVRFPTGYHRLVVKCRAGTFECLVIAAPAKGFDKPGKTWGVFLPLYSLRSQHGWGAGDFSDLEQLMVWASAQGAHVVSTLPLMAAFLDNPYEISPYMPASRLFWNELYVDPRRAPEFEQCPAARSLVNSSFFERDVAELRQESRVNHRRLMALKRPVLEAMAQWLEQANTHRTAEFREYVRQCPELREYARFRAITEKQAGPWPTWPHRLRGGQVKAADYDGSNERYHAYAQWLAEEQLERISSGADGGAGLYLDFPLGVHPYSYDVWSRKERFALHASTGAPPDTLFRKGQNWAFPPPQPTVMRQQGYAYQISCLRKQLRHTSWLRIDHVMGLHRLFWIPQGVEARDGVYVQYPAEELYAILSVESHRAKTIVVGENLGTVPQEVNRAMEKHGLKPMYVVQYEAQPSGKRSLPPVRSGSVASLNTHDMPPFAAFLEGIDLREMEEVGLFDRKEAAEQVENRKKIRQGLERLLATQADQGAGPLMEACQEWLAGQPAKMLLVNLEDLWLETEPQNVPGTHLERANWQRKARYSIEEFRFLSSVTRLLDSIRRLRAKASASRAASRKRPT
jgi:4-alpha-glucanotransferase